MPQSINWHAVITTGLAVAIAYTGIVITYSTMGERTENLVLRETDHEQRIRRLESDRALDGKISDLSIQLVRLEGEIRALRAELKK